MMSIQMKSPNIGADGAPTRYILSPVSTSSTRKSSHLCELFVRGPMATPPKKQSIYDVIGGSPQTEDQDLLLKQHKHNSLYMEKWN